MLLRLAYFIDGASDKAIFLITIKPSKSTFLQFENVDWSNRMLIHSYRELWGLESNHLEFVRKNVVCIHWDRVFSPFIEAGNF